MIENWTDKKNTTSDNIINNTNKNNTQIFNSTNRIWINFNFLCRESIQCVFAALFICFGESERMLDFRGRNINEIKLIPFNWFLRSWWSFRLQRQWCWFVYFFDFLKNCFYKIYELHKNNKLMMIFLLLLFISSSNCVCFSIIESIIESQTNNNNHTTYNLIKRMIELSSIRFSWSAWNLLFHCHSCEICWSCVVVL